MGDNISGWKPTWKKEGIDPSSPINKIDSFLDPIERNEIIQPYLDKWERNTLTEILLANAKEKNIDQIERNGKTYSFKEFVNRNLSTIYDLYNLYNIPSEELKLVGETEHNKNKFKFIFKANEPNIKPVTRNHSLYSYTIMEELVHALFELVVEEGDPSQDDSIANFGQGGDNSSSSNGGGNNKEDQEEQKRQEEKLEDTIKEALDKGADKVDDIDQKEIGGDQASKNSNSLHSIKKDLDFLKFMEQIHVDPKLLSKFAKQVGNLTCNYFSPRVKEHEVPILEADEIEELEGLENFIPPLNKLLYEDVTTTRKTYLVGFDVYIDYSGSMCGSVKLPSGDYVNRLALCKVCALKLMDANIIEDVHFFDTKFQKNVTRERLLEIQPNGGTDIDMVIQEIIASGKSALILTDLGDYIHQYHPNVFFVSFDKYYGFTQNEFGQQYLKNGQCVYFDGDVFKVIKGSDANKW